LLTFALIGLFAGLSLALGHRLLRAVGPAELTTGEAWVFGFPIGAGCLAYFLLALGLLGWLTASAIAATLLALSAWLAPELTGLFRDMAAVPVRTTGFWRRDRLEWAVVLAGGAVLLVSLVNALTPPWDYDGLMYHLVGPKVFLEAGRVFPYLENWFVNGPFTVELMFSVGMAFGDDTFPKLVHFLMGLTYFAATYLLARRLLTRRAAWLALAILLTIPAIPVWAGFAYADLGWATYELLAVSAICAWRQGGDRRWLVLGGGMIGFALGSKYLGVLGLGTIILWAAFWGRDRLRAETLRGAAQFGLVAAVVASPWYLRNLLWFGNPVYPFLFGGPGWNTDLAESLSAFLQSFGTGRGPLDFLLLPLSIYARHERFGAVINQIDIPSVLFPLVLLYPWTKRDPSVGMLLQIAAVRFVLWSFGSHQIRFLLPIYPLLAIATAGILLGTSDRASFTGAWRRFGQTLAIGLIAITLFYQVGIALDLRPWDTQLGAESRIAFLQRNVKDLAAIRYFQANADRGARLLLFSDGRGYFCIPDCLPDPGNFVWATGLVHRPQGTSVGQWLKAVGASHVLMSWEDLDFLLQHDPRGVIEQAARELIEWRDSGCLRRLYGDQWAELYAIACDA
jgi:4-amino-4-deoxy-L-arabinose transferase-like glycosyltransferase